jgi:hypothetical protein
VCERWAGFLGVRHNLTEGQQKPPTPERDSVTRWRFFLRSKHFNQFSSAGLSLAAGKIYARINLSQAAYGMILQNHRRILVSIFSVKIAALGSLKRVTGRIFEIEIVGTFKGAN